MNAQTAQVETVLLGQLSEPDTSIEDQIQDGSSGIIVGCVENIFLLPLLILALDKIKDASTILLKRHFELGFPCVSAQGFFESTE